MRSIFKLLSLLALTVYLLSGEQSMAAGGITQGQNFTQIIARLRLQARQANDKSFWQTPLILVGIFTNQIKIPPQKRQFLDLNYIQSIAPVMFQAQSESLPPLAEMLKSSNSFERETVAELINFESKNKWVLTPGFCTVLSRQIEKESDDVVHFDLFTMASQAQLQSPDVLESTNKWVRKNYRKSDYLATHAVLCMTHMIATAPDDWTKEVNEGFQTLGEMAQDRDEHSRYRVRFAVETVLQTQPQTRYTERLRQLLDVQKQ